MKILFDISHPAAFHCFKHTIHTLMDNGHEVKIIARDRNEIIALLEDSGLDYVNRGKGSDSVPSRLFYLLQADVRILKESFSFKPDLFISQSSPYAAQAAWLTGKPHICFNDTEHTDALHRRLTYPFSDVIITPEVYRHRLGKKHIRIKSNLEHLYLNPVVCKSGGNIYSLLNIKEDQPFVVLRFVSWQAYHDQGQKGLSIQTKRKLIQTLKSDYRIFISSEGPLEEEFEEYRLKIPAGNIHDVLSKAELFIGESATMASESAMLGTYAIYINSLPLMSYLQQEEDYGLLKHFTADGEVAEYAEGLINNKRLKQETQEKSRKLQATFINSSEFLYWFITNYPESKNVMYENPCYQDRF